MFIYICTTIQTKRVCGVKGTHIYACVHVYMSIHIYIYIYTNMNIYMNIYTNIQICVLTCAHLYFMRARQR